MLTVDTGFGVFVLLCVEDGSAVVVVFAPHALKISEAMNNERIIFFMVGLWRQCHKWDRHEYQNEDDDHRKSKQASVWVKGGDLVQRLGIDASQPE